VSRPDWRTAAAAVGRLVATRPRPDRGTDPADQRTVERVHAVAKHGDVETLCGVTVHTRLVNPRQTSCTNFKACIKATLTMLKRVRWAIDKG
jgi:hypothetical protein